MPPECEPLYQLTEPRQVLFPLVELLVVGITAPGVYYVHPYTDGNAPDRVNISTGFQALDTFCLPSH